MTTTLSAPDISCGGCANAIKRALGTTPGVSEVTVDVAAKLVAVTHEEAEAPLTAILAALDWAGFPATAVNQPVSGVGGNVVPAPSIRNELSS